MRKVLPLLLLTIIGFSLMAQDSVRVVEKVMGEWLTADPNGNIYLVDGQRLIKCDADGNLLYTYDDAFYGAITSIDVDNPMKIMVFYRESGRIVFLDERLSPVTEPLDLFSHEYLNITLAAFSTDNLIWLYDETHNELLCVDFYLKGVSRNRLTISDFKPSQLLACQEKFLLMNNPGDGVYFFDGFGTFVKRLPFVAEALCGFYRNKLCFLTENELCHYDHQLMELVKTPRPKGAISVVETLSHLYYLDESQRLNIVFRK